jgi:dephospho-CoA kinase
MIVGITGYLASGKDTVADILIKKGFNHYSLSDELRAILKERGVESTRENQQKIGNELREKYGSEYLAKRVIEKVTEPSVITSIRSVGETSFLKNKGMKLIFVDAPIELRYERIQNRKREGEGILSFEQFKAQEDFEKGSNSNSQQLHLVAEMADYTIINSGTLDELDSKIDKILEEIHA